MNDWSEKGKMLGKILTAMYGVTAILLFLLSALVQRFRMDAGKISIGISAVYVISCFMGGFLAGKVTKQRKFLWGLLLGTTYLILMLCITLASKGTIAAKGSELAVSLLLCLGGGMAGGMIS